MKNDTAQPATDDQELAQVLAGNDSAPASTGLQFEETPLGGNPADAAVINVAPEDTQSLENAVHDLAQPAMVSAAATNPPVAPATTPVQSAPTAPGDLEGIKKDALTELRPLVEKLTLSPEEKFDIMLLIIRSTDDQTLVKEAHEAAKNIEDETRRAQALLDIVKEIDYFANQSPAS